MTRRSRRSSSGPQRVGSDEGLTSSKPAPEDSSAQLPADSTEPVSQDSAEAEPAPGPEPEPTPAGGRHTRPEVEQTKDDTDEGWGEPGDDDAAARWLRENRPPHWS